MLFLGGNKMRIDYYKHKEHLDKILSSIKSSDQISPRNKELIFSFEKQLYLDNITLARCSSFVLALLATS